MDKKPKYGLRFPTLFEELDDIKRRLMKLESKSDTYDELWEVRTLEEMDNLIREIRKEMEGYGVVFVTLEKHD